MPGREEESAGVNRSKRSPEGNRQTRRILNQAANAAVKHKGSIFDIVYRRLVPCLGHNKTIGAIRIGGFFLPNLLAEFGAIPHLHQSFHFLPGGAAQQVRS